MHAGGSAPGTEPTGRRYADITDELRRLRIDFDLERPLMGSAELLSQSQRT